MNIRETNTSELKHLATTGEGTELDPFVIQTGTYIDPTLPDPTLPFKYRVNMGVMPGYSTLDKFGVNPLIGSSGGSEDVWEYGGLYNYDDFGTAPIQYVSSDDTGDTGQTIVVEGLDINGDSVQQTIITNGENNVVFTTPLWRLYRMYNNSDQGGDLTGTLYGHTDPAPTGGVPNSANVRAIISNGNNQTLMSLYTIPKGKVGFLTRGELGVELEGNAASLAEYANFHYYSRRVGKVWTIKKSVTCLVGGAAVYQDERSFADIIPSLTDIRLNVKSVSADMGVWGTFDILLVDEDRFSLEYLQAIGQPGY